MSPRLYDKPSSLCRDIVSFMSELIETFAQIGPANLLTNLQNSKQVVSQTNTEMWTTRDVNFTKFLMTEKTTEPRISW
jgi:hypothetical protein